MDSPPRRPTNKMAPQSATNPLGGRVHGARSERPARRYWSGYVAYVRTCPTCGWENDETALFCVSCAEDIRHIDPEASSDTRPGVLLLQKRLDRERRQHARSRGSDASGGGGWIGFGAALILAALVVGPDRMIATAVWIAAVTSSVVGIWQLRRDQRALRMWGGILASSAALVLLIVGFRAIRAAGNSSDLSPPSIEASVPAIATPAAETAGSRKIEGNVPMYGGGPTHDGMMPGPAPASAPVLAWQMDTAGELYASPTLANGVLYVMSKAGTLYAVEASSGNERWRREVTTYVTRASPAVVDGVVYVGGGFTFSALDAATGAELWTVPLEYAGHASPTVVDGLIVVGSQQGWVYALSAATGEIEWRVPTEGIVFGAAAISDRSVVYGTDEGILYNVDAVDGSLNWRINLPGALYASPVITGDTVLVATQSGELHARDLATGDGLWNANYGGPQPPATNGKVVVLTAADGGVYGLDATTGNQLWLYPSGKLSLTSPSISGNLVLFGAGNTLYALNIETGEAVWYYLAGDKVESPAAIAEGFVFFGSRDGFVNAVTDR